MQNLKSLKAYFYRGGTFGDILHETIFDEIVERLKLNIASTDELILDYLKTLNDSQANNHSHVSINNFSLKI